MEYFIIPGDVVQIWVNGNMVHETISDQIIQRLYEGDIIKVETRDKLYEVQNVRIDEEFNVVEIDCKEIEADYCF